MTPDHGPPPDPRELVVPSGLVDAPMAWGVCVLVGVALCLVGRRSRLALAAGVSVLLTAPALGMVPLAVWGAYPTIDKAGSLHFYALGAHLHAFDTTAVATQLIGVSMGHLWVTALFDLVLSPFAANNAQALLNVALGWWLAAALATATGTPARWSLVAAFPMGLGLHTFRDIQWYTIEKSGTWPLTLYVLALVRASQRGGWWIPAAGLAYSWAFFYNAYWGVLGAMVGGAAILAGNRNTRLAVAAAALGGLPFLLLQLPALRNSQLPAPDAFAARAALDVFSPFGDAMWPPNWNRLELWRALDLVVTVAALASVVAAVRGWRAPSSRPTLVLAAGMALAGGLAMGPATPLWAAFASLPGLWRFAKPETFFHLVVLGSVVLAGRCLGKERVPRWAVVLVQLGLWLLLVRGHPVYPGFSGWLG
ncbi:MAG: hypothetical protein EXR71_05410 [Myxococcales bacterium]|nr:hypothetical protein [Myxococcales bacterium]